MSTRRGLGSLLRTDSRPADNMAAVGGRWELAMAGGGGGVRQSQISTPPFRRGDGSEDRRIALLPHPRAVPDARGRCCVRTQHDRHPERHIGARPSDFVFKVRYTVLGTLLLKNVNSYSKIQNIIHLRGDITDILAKTATLVRAHYL